MNAVIFGASGMVGQGVLLECLRDRDVERVLVIGRSNTGRQDAKLREVLVKDLFDVAAYREEAGRPGRLVLLPGGVVRGNERRLPYRASFLMT